MTERGVSRSLNSAVTARRPSTRSNTRALDGVSSNAVTRTRRVVDWIAGGSDGGRRSRRSYSGFSDCLRCSFGNTYIHVYLSSEESARWRME